MQYKGGNAKANALVIRHSAHTRKRVIFFISVICNFEPQLQILGALTRPSWAPVKRVQYIHYVVLR